VTLLITGATGFVMSVLARHWLEAHPTERLVALDAAPMDHAAQRYFAPVADRLTTVVADVTQPERWRPALDAHTITFIVHGAAVTPISRGTTAEVKREPESEAPAHILDVNIMGTVAVLEWARSLRSLRRFVYVSSGSVYKHHGPDRPGEPLPEDGYVMPRRLYGISKLASELITERYGDLFGFSAASVRLSSVYGPMDRETGSRNFRHIPHRIAQKALEGARSIRVNALDGVGDYIQAEDVASAIARLLKAPMLRFGTYNIAAGETATVSDIARWAAERVPGFRAEVVSPEHADIVQDPTLNGGMWGAYDISRIAADTGWKPRATRDAFLAYMDWLSVERGDEVR
jgi:UDP-glucose 4-epimerase